MNLQTRQIVGAEALVRWQHPTRGMVPPMIRFPLPNKPVSSPDHHVDDRGKLPANALKCKVLALISKLR